MTSTNPAQQVAVRLATSADAAGIAAIGRETFKVSFGHSMGSEDMQAYLDGNYLPELIEKEMSNPSNTFMVARQQDEENRILGFLQLKRGTTEPYLPTDISLIELHRIYMHHESSGRGTGQLLVDEAHRVARLENFAAIWLGVWEENLKAQRFYERKGYERVGHHDFVIGNEVQRDFVMLKKF